MSGLSCLDKLLYHILKLLTEEHGDNGRRSLICPQPVIISHIRGRLTKQISMNIHRLHNTGKHKQELNVFIRRITRIEHINTIICRERPVVVLARTVDARKWLLVQQTCHAMMLCHSPHCLHDKLIVIHSNVGCLIDRRKLMLCRSNFIMLRLGGYA